MEFSEDFVLPEIEVTTKPVPEVQANDDAFYAAGSYGTDPVNNYTQMYTELSQEGYSEIFEAAKKTWQLEQSSSNKEGMIKQEQGIYKSQQGFYLCVENKTLIPAEPKFNLTIYYKVEQFTELFMFLSQLLKQFKNDTTTNK